MPALNAGQYIHEAVSSLQAQCLQNWELIFVDNGSTDQTAEIMAGFASLDDRIKLYGESRKGAWAARNKGLNLARGEFVFFLDADDYLPDSSVFKDLYVASKKNNVSISGGSKVVVRQDGSTITSFEGLNDGLTFKSEGLTSYDLYQFDYGFYRFLYNRKFLLETDCFFPPYQRYEDPPFFVNAMLGAGQFFALVRPSYVYRLGHQSVKWDAEAIGGLLLGLAHNIRVSRQKGLCKLHRLTVDRLTQEYAQTIQHAKVYKKNSLHRAESQCLSSIDISILNGSQKKSLLEFYRQKQATIESVSMNA
jgi:glycosyltransferase involved in cell wall biosynthesis